MDDIDKQEEANVNNELFKGVSFCLCENVNDFDNIKNILISKGGSYKNYVSDLITHVIGDDPEHPSIQDAELFEKFAVTSQWVILSNQSNVQLPLEPFYTDKKNKIFHKLVFTISSCLSDDKSKLWAIVTYHGGQFQRDLNDKCTHLITTKCKGNKYDKACKLQSNLKIITPDWLLDSIEQGKLCDESIYHPKYLITAEYLQKRKEKEERLRMEEERKKLEEEAHKLERENKKLEDEKRRNEEKKRIEERKKLIDEERKKMQEEAIKKQQEEEAIKKQQQEEASKKQQTLVQNKLSSNNVNNSSTHVQNSSSISSQHLPTSNTISAISTQTTNNSINVPATQLTLRTVSFPSTSLVSNISVSQNAQQSTTVTSPSIGGTQKIKLLVPTNHQIARMSTQSTISTTMNTTNLIQTSPNQNVQSQQIKSHILTPHTSSMAVQQGQNIQYSTGQTNLNNQNQYQQTVNMNQTGQLQQQNIQQHQIAGHPQQITISQPTQAITIQQQQQTGTVQQLRPGDQTLNTSRPVYLAVQPARQIGQPQPQFNFIQIRPPQFMPNQQPVQQQNQQIRFGQQQQQIRSIQPNQLNNQTGNVNTQTAQIIQNQPITISSSPNAVQNANKSINVSTNEMVPNTQVHKASNIILQQRVQPPVQLQAQQNQQQQQQQQQQQHQQQQQQQQHQNIQQQNMQQQNIQSMIIQQQPNQMAGNSQLNQTNQPQSIQVVPAQQFIQIQRHQLNQQQIIRGQNSQQIIFQPANSIQQNGPRQLQTMPQGAIFQQQSPTQNQVQRLQQVKMPQNNNIQTQQARVATVSSIHPQQATQLTQQQANMNQKPQRFLIKSPPQYNQQCTPTSMVTIRAPIQQQQQQQQPNQMQTSPMHSNQSKPMISSTSPQQQIVNKFNPNQPNQTRQQWTNGPTQQQHMQMQLAPGQVIVHNQHSTQQIPQQTTMILQGPPQQIQTTQQWPNQSNLNNQNIQTMVQVRPQQNVQMMNIQQQQQQPQTIRVIQQPTTPTQQPVNRLLQSPQGAMKATPTLISHQIPIITDHNNVSNQVRVEQVNCMLNLNADQATLANTASNANSNSNAKSKLANYILKNRLKNNSNTSNSPNKKDNSKLNKVEITNKAVDNLRSLDGCSPSSSNSSVSSILVQNNQSSSVAECSNLEPEVIVDKYYSFDSKISVPLDICLIGCVFYLVEYDNGLFKLDDDKRKSVEKNILKHGGQLVSEYSSKVTHVICESYLNQHVQRALKENKRCVTVFWLDDVLEDKKMRYPFRPWHLPRKFDLKSSPCKNKIISISNFNTNERNRICEIINLAGGNCTSYMTDKNTLLVCKKFEGKKFRKAIEWGIDVVNHLWLQDLWFDKLKDQVDKRYTVCDDKDSLDLDYKLTKELMIGWRTSLKLNEQDHKRLNEFKETSNSKNWKKPDLMSSVLTSKENLIENSNSSTSLSSNLKSTLVENNKINSNSINNQNNNSSSNDVSQTNSQTVTSLTFAISNQTDTLTTLISTTENSLNNSSTTISTNLPKIKSENSLSPNLTYQKSENTNELSIKKENVDNEFQVEEDKNKVPTNDVQKSDEPMEVDCAPQNNDLNAISESSNQPKNPIINNIESNLLNSSITIQSTDTKPSLIDIRPTEELAEGKKESKENGTEDISLKLKETSNQINNEDQESKKIETVVCTTPAILTTASVRLESNLDSNENLKTNSIDQCVANTSAKNKLDNETNSDQPSPKRLKPDTNEENDKMDVDLQPDSTVCKAEKPKEEITQNPSMNGLHNHNSDKEEINENKDTNNLSTQQQSQSNEKLKSKRSSDIRILFTNVANSKELTDIAISLGGKVVSQHTECTHLVTSKLDRTVKFICAFNYAHYIMDPNWLIKSKEQGFFLKESDHFLVDKSGEEHFGFKIDESFERRNKRDKPLFAKMVFFITKSCVPSCKILRDLIKSAGGMAVFNKVPSPQQIDNLKSIGQTFVVISCEKDLYLCDMFLEKEIPVLHPEFVLSNILKQKLEYEPYLIDYSYN